MKKKLMAFIITTLIFCFLIITVFFTIILNYQYDENIKKHLIMNNDLLINLLSSNNIVDIDKLFNQNYNNSNIRVTLIDYDGKVLYDTDANRNDMDNHNNRLEIEKARIQKYGYSLRYSKTLKKNMMYVAEEFNNGYIIRSSMPMEIINGIEGKYLRYYLLILCIVFLLAIGFSSNLAKAIVKPIKDLDLITSKISKGELYRRVKVNSDDEVGQLAENFNYMADKLQSTLKDVLDKQNRLEAILKSMDSGVVAVDRNFKIIMINPYAIDIFGIKKENDIIGKNFLDVIRNHELENIFKYNNGDYKQIKVLLPRERDLRIKTADIINKNEHIGTVAVVQDVTDMKKLENIRTQFVANVSHELKTPLTSIKGFAETLREVDDKETREKFINIINEEAERLTNLINDILSLSDIERTKEMKIERFNASKIIEDVCKLLKSSADKKNITLKIEGESIINLNANKDRFKQMIINLIDNAIKYTNDNDFVYIGSKIQDNIYLFWVEDNGPGIPKEDIPRIFERFYRVDKARSRAQGGTGLGLAIVKHIVLSFNGNIKVESKVGRGSKFIVEIPKI